MTIITRKHGRALVSEGLAKVETAVTDNGQRYVAITRYDAQRTDHYPVTDAEANTILTHIDGLDRITS